MLKDSKIIKSDYCDIYKTHNVLKELLMDVTDVKLILPFFHQDYKFIFEHLIENNVNIELLLSETIVSIFLKNLNSEILKIAIDKGNIKIKSVKNDVKIALTVANNFMTLGLFKLDETYDQNRILVSNEKLAIEWGKNLFKKHEKNGNKLYYSL